MINLPGGWACTEVKAHVAGVAWRQRGCGGVSVVCAASAHRPRPRTQQTAVQARVIASSYAECSRRIVRSSREPVGGPSWIVVVHIVLLTWVVCVVLAKRPARVRQAVSGFGEGKIRN